MRMRHPSPAARAIRKQPRPDDGGPDGSRDALTGRCETLDVRQVHLTMATLTLSSEAELALPVEEAAILRRRWSEWSGPGQQRHGDRSQRRRRC